MRHYHYCFYDEDKGELVHTEVSRREAKKLLEHCYVNVDAILDVDPCPSLYPLMGSRRIAIEED